MPRGYGRFKSFLILLLVFSLVLSIVNKVFGEAVTEAIRKDLKKRSIYGLVVAGIGVGELADNLSVDYTKCYFESEGIIILIAIDELDEYKGITQEDLNSFFASIWTVFGGSRYPTATRINFYIQIGPVDSLIVKFPIGALYDLYKEKISRSDFLKKCDIWINGEKAIVEGDTIKVLGKEFKMNFEL